MLSDLRAERERLTEAIAVFERLAAGRGWKRRGRPPAWMKAIADVPDKRHVSAEGRARMAAAQKKRWAAKKKRAAAAD